MTERHVKLVKRLLMTTSYIPIDMDILRFT